MAKSIKFNNNNFLDSKGIVHKKSLLSDLLDLLSEKSKSCILYDNTDGLVAPSGGTAVHLNDSVVHFGAILILSANGWGIVDTKLNQNNFGNGVTMWWFNDGFYGTFYNNTIYKVIGIGRL